MRGKQPRISDAQWQEIEEKLNNGATTIALGKEYGIDRTAISRKFAHKAAHVRSIAEKIVDVHTELRLLAPSQRSQALRQAELMESMSTHLLTAGNYGASISHRLKGIAHGLVEKVDDNFNPHDEDHMTTLKGVAALIRTSNESSQIAVEILKASKKDTNADANTIEHVDRPAIASPQE